MKPPLIVRHYSVGAVEREARAEERRTWAIVGSVLLAVVLAAGLL